MASWLGNSGARRSHGVSGEQAGSGARRPVPGAHVSNTPPLDDDNPAAEEDAADALVEDPTADADIPDEDADNDDEPGANDDPEKELLAPCEDGPLLDAALDVATATEVAPPTLVLACAVAQDRCAASGWNARAARRQGAAA